MKKVLFLIHDLGHGGAEKVLVNLVNHMDPARFDITVTVLFGGGVNEQFLAPHVRLRHVFSKSFPGNSHFMKLLTPRQLHRLCVKEHYDIEISYLEGPSARVISGCPDKNTRLISWIHVEQHTLDVLASSFRNQAEAKWCYERFDQTVCVSQYVHDDFCSILKFTKPCCVLYNTVESDAILNQSVENADEMDKQPGLSLVAVGSLKKSKGYNRLFRIIRRIKDEGYSVCLYVLGEGEQRQELERLVVRYELADRIKLLGYRLNPYKYIAKADMLVCASFAEGFSTAVTEALIVGTPVCTVDVSGMRELLGESNEYGIVTENDEEALYLGMKRLLDDPVLLEHYRKMAKERGKRFSTENTVRAVEKLMDSLIEDVCCE